MGCALCLAVAVRIVWFQVAPDRGQVFRGLFEAPHETPEIALKDCCGDEFFPGPGFDRHGTLSISPGMVGAVALEPGGRYVVTSDGDERVPYVVFGDARAAGEASWVSNPHRLAVHDGRLELVQWNSALPWSEDAAWLSALREQCATGQPAMTIGVASADPELTVEIGRCRTAVAIRDFATGHPTMAVVAGPTWAWARREAPGFRTHVEMNPRRLGQVLVLCAIVMAALWRLGTRVVGVVAIGLLLTSVWSVFVAWLFFVLLVAGAACTGLLDVCDRLMPFRSRAMRRSVGALVLMTGAAAMAILVRQQMIATGFQEKSWASAVSRPPAEGAPPACGLVGYSAVADDQLLAGGGISTMLGACPACSGGLVVTSRHGGTLDWVQRQVCSSDLPAGTGAVVLYGGANDDMLWLHDRDDYWRDARGLFEFAGAEWERRLQPAHLAHVVDALALSAWNARDEQAAAVRAAVQCARERGSRFIFVHDLLITDLVGGRSPLRRQLLAARRTAMTPDGRATLFIDSVEALRGRIGVSWFNDVRHPSFVGHRGITDYVCGLLAAPT